MLIQIDKRINRLLYQETIKRSSLVLSCDNGGGLINNNNNGYL